MALQTFTYHPKVFAQLDVTEATTQADVVEAFAALDTSGWAQAPTWDPDAQEVRWKKEMYGGVEEICPVGSSIAIEQPNPALPPPSSSDGQPQVITYPDGLDPSAVTYL